MAVPLQMQDQMLGVSPYAKDMCTKSLAITLIVASIVGLVCGVLAYHVATGQLSLNAFSSISQATSICMMGGFSSIAVVSSIALAYLEKKS